MIPRASLAPHEFHAPPRSSRDWHLVAPALRERGHDPVAVDLPSEDESAGWSEYTDTVVRAAGDRSDLVVVAHSLGGFTAPLVCARLPAKLLVLVAGMIPSPGEFFSDWWRNSGYEETGYEDVFYHDVPPALAAEARRRERSESSKVLKEPWPLTAWPETPTRYLLCRDDRMFPADEIDGGHYIALSRPREGVEHHGAERARRGGVGRQPGPLRERVVNWPMLRSRALRTLLVAAAASNLGDGVTVAAAPLLAASLTEDPRRIGAVGVALTLPWLLFALPSGAVADRADRRWLMVAADLARTACMGLLALAVLTGQASIPILLVVFFATTTADTVFHNASQAALPMVVDRDGLPRANARFQTVQIVGATLVGPALGGLLFAAAAAAPFALDAVSFAVSAALLATLPGRLRPERAEAPSTIRADIVEGARWLLGHRVLRTICWVLTLENIAEVAGYVMLVLLAREGLGLDARGYGLLLASSAAGGLLGAAVTERLHRQAGDAGSLVGATVAMAGARALLAATTSPAVAGLALALYGFAAVWWNIVTASFRQAVVPERLQGRVNSAYRLASWGASSLGAAAGGLVAAALGLRAVYAGAAVLVGLLAVILWRRLDAAAFAAARQAATS